jgi:hypothetical protein
MRILRVLAAALCAATLSSFAAVPKGMAPVAAQYLSGSTFLGPDGWFRIDGPQGWQWFEMRAFDGDADPRWPDSVHGTVGWLVDDPMSFDSFVLLEIYTPGGAIIDDTFMQSFERVTRRHTSADGKLSDFRYELIPIPDKDSAHYSYTLVKKNGKTVYRHGFVTGMEHKLVLSTSTETPAEPRWFARVAVSIRWLHEP